MVLLVDNLHMEHNILWERIVQLNIDLTCLVELGRFIDSIDRISLIDVREELEHHSSSLHVALLLVREDDLASHLLRDPALKLDWEVELLAWLYSHRFRFNGEVRTAIELHPVADWVLGWVAELDVLGNHVT